MILYFLPVPALLLLVLALAGSGFLSYTVTHKYGKAILNDGAVLSDSDNSGESDKSNESDDEDEDRRENTTEDDDNSGSRSSDRESGQRSTTVSGSTVGNNAEDGLREEQESELDDLDEQDELDTEDLNDDFDLQDSELESDAEADIKVEGNVVLKSMPDVIVDKALNADDLEDITSVDLDNESGLEYVVKGNRAERLLGFLTIKLPTTLIYDAQTGDLLRINQDFLSKLLKLLSF